MTASLESQNRGVPLDEVNLHDAVLYYLRSDWRERTCEIFVAVFIEPGKTAVSCVIRAHGVRAVLMPHHAPWGDSVSINDQRWTPEGRCIIEMQSGDVIEIEADQVELVRLDGVCDLTKRL